MPSQPRRLAARPSAIGVRTRSAASLRKSLERPSAVDIVAFPELAATTALLNGVRVSTRIMPAERATRGGDWCEAFALPNGIIALSIGDICGHGPGTFEAMVLVRQAVRDAAYRGLEPAIALAEANLLLRHHYPQTYATAIFALLHASRCMITFANAGHPAPLMAGPGASVFLEFREKDLPLGVDLEVLQTTHVVTVPAETLLVFYTDGVTERDRKPLEGELQLRDAATFAYHHSALPTASVIERQMFLTGANHDDAAILTAWTPRAPLGRKPMRKGHTRDRLLAQHLIGWPVPAVGDAEARSAAYSVMWQLLRASP
jgi:stage II sporulation SpoE-like protein